MSGNKYLGPYAKFVDLYSTNEFEHKTRRNILIDTVKQSQALVEEKSVYSQQSEIKMIRKLSGDEKNSEGDRVSDLNVGEERATNDKILDRESQLQKEGATQDSPKKNPFLQNIKAKVGNVLDAHIPMPEKTAQHQANKKPYMILHFFLRFIFDFFICFPFFILRCLFDGFQEIRLQFHKKNTLFAFKLLGCYFLDILSPLSVLFLHSLIIFGDKDSVYYQWCVTCETLFLSYLALTAYFSVTMEGESSQIQKINQCRDLFSVKHWSNLGLGQFRDWLVAQRKESKQAVLSKQFNSLETDGSSKNELQKGNSSDRFTLRNSLYSNLHQNIYSMEYFDKIMKKIFKKLNIDTTFLDFAYFGDAPKTLLTESDLHPEESGVMNHSDSMVEENDLHPTLEHALYYTKRKAKFLLWKIYKNSLDFTSKSETDKYIELLVMIIIIVIKLILPFVYAIGFSTSNVKGFELFTIMVFYVYILSLFSSIIDNADLKRRSYMLEALSSMISFEGNIKHESSIKFKLDVLCPLSLESWDNLRRCALLLDKDKTERFEIIYLFLGVYGIFTLFILTMVIFEVQAIIPSGTVFHEPLYVMIVCIDFFLILIVVMTRIFYGSQFNKNFANQRDHLSNIHGILDDLQQLQDLYFRHNEPIENVTYRNIVDKIREKAELAVKKKEREGTDEPVISPINAQMHNLKTPRHSKDLNINRNSLSPTFGKEGVPMIEISRMNHRNQPNIAEFEAKVQVEIAIKIVKAKEALEKVLGQVKYDRHHYSHKFLGKFQSDFDQNFSQLIIISIPILPPLINKLTGNNNIILPNM